MNNIIVSRRKFLAGTTQSSLGITPIGVNIVRVEGGKFREVRAYFDSSILR